MQKIKLGILISGKGSNLKAIYENINSGKLDNAEIACVVSNKDDVGYRWALKQNDLNLYLIKEATYGTKHNNELHEILIKDGLDKYGVQVVILAGYMRMVGKTLLEAYQGRILNIHPSLLPAFRGLNAYKQALERGVKLTGVTVHMVDAGMDTGKILKQEYVSVHDDDTQDSLTERGLKVEHDLYTRAIKEFIEKEFKCEDNPEDRKIQRIVNVNTGMSNCI